MYKAAPGHIVSPDPWTHTTLFDSLDRDRVNGAIHDIDHPAVTEGGLAVLRGNLAPDGCVVKTAGVPKEIWTFRGPALVVESQEEAIEVILNDTLKPGMALVIRYEGPKGGPGMQEMLSDFLRQGQGHRQGSGPPDRRSLFRRLLGPVHRPHRA